MAIGKNILEYVQQKLCCQIISSAPVPGGSINQAYCLQTSNEKYFIKLNSRSRYPGMFEAEAAGLNVIARSKSIAVPGVVLQGSAGDESFLLLEWIDAGRPTPNALLQLGRNLAKLHKHTSAHFGSDRDNYMGSLPQSNKRHTTWSAFFIEERLQPMIKMAVDKHLLTSKDALDFSGLFKKLPGLFNEEAPSLIHGDLWSGNYLVGLNDKPYLVDPAVSFGHRECDIAMTTLFGGFPNEFYQAYNETFPLAKGWEQRLGLWNLYPLLVHLNLFGAGYLARVRDCLKASLVLRDFD